MNAQRLTWELVGLVVGVAATVSAAWIQARSEERRDRDLEDRIRELEDFRDAHHPLLPEMHQIVAERRRRNGRDG